ncbi:Holliday junction branch migration protein RuvA [Chenggangzhangella methanolivorans]|uniref:Holliday junction branch migration complex subunit RuvA n=1 Tax=Chenggangzhangella methanolivorans TaxID=1437009 RepID=A0A9E6UIY2_9HYPH|nr:Holliday junction branch migration protein RuvA [Chenggangzhangella methanolivorans]QZO01368.1 Holliday junction branch migration protein RuvA [Chenggangzhangella methanolivorans]
MIGKLTGTVDSVGPDWVILDVGGVGYVVYCSTKTLSRLPKAGETARLSIETHVREDRIQLFGFMADLEREWFRLLNTVPGIGTKVALAVLSTLDAPDLATAIALRDVAAISRAPGVGPKVAARVAAELKDKAPLFADVDPGLARVAGEVAEARGAATPVRDAVSALVNLGYAAPQASAAVAAAKQSLGDDATTERLIRAGLKELAKG